jgi:hypothetical protein
MITVSGNSHVCAHPLYTPHSMSLPLSRSRCRSTPHITVPPPQTPRWPAVFTAQQAPSTTSRLPSPTSPGCPLPSLRGRSVAVAEAKSVKLQRLGSLSSPNSRVGSSSVQVSLNLRTVTTSIPIPIAEVGSALLQRHEAYVRKHGVRLTCTLHDATPSPPAQPSVSALRKATQDSAPGHAETDQADVDARVAELLKENAVLDKVNLSRPCWIRMRSS